MSIILIILCKLFILKRDTRTCHLRRSWNFSLHKSDVKNGEKRRQSITDT